jgi:hypothetical protein
MNQTGRIFACLSLAASCATAGSVSLLAQEKASSKIPYEGVWTLSFRVATKPGGEVLELPGVTAVPMNLVFQATKQSFAVEKDGQFKWEERNDGQFHSDTRLIDKLGQESYPGQTTGPLLKAAGQLDAARKLKLQFAWSHGSGRFVDGVGGGTLSVSLDGKTATTSGAGGSRTSQHYYFNSTWELSPDKIKREELGQDVVRETATYTSRRPAKLPWGMSLPVVEEVEIIQVRYLELVPRG